MLRILKADFQKLAEASMDWVNNIDKVVLEQYNLVRLPDLLAEATVVSALFLPDVLLRPSINHLEPFHEKDSKVLRLVVGAAMYGWNDTFHDLSKNVEDIDLWNSQLN
jgi:hypothetical protein